MSARAQRSTPAAAAPPSRRRPKKRAEEEPRPRKLRPRETVAVAPIAVSDRTATLHGWRSARAFRAFVRRHAVKHTLDGRTVIVDAEVMRQTLARLARAAELDAGDVLEHGSDGGDELDDADSILEALGLERSAVERAR